MFISCCKEIGSPKSIPSSTLLTIFDGNSHRPHEIFPFFLIRVGGKVVNVEVEILDVNLNYNLLLGQNWVYVMEIVVSSLFCILSFPHNGRIIMVDKLAHSPNDSNASSDSVFPLVNNSHYPIDNFSVWMYSP